MILRLFIYALMFVGSIQPSLSSKLEKQLGVSIEEAYRPCIVRPEKSFDDDVFQNSLTNVNNKNANVQKEARSTLRQMAIAGHLDSMVEMGKLCMAQPKKFDSRYFYALRWFVLTYQVEYLRLGKSGPKGLGAIRLITNDPAAQKDADCKCFKGSLRYFLEGHEARTPEMIGCFIRLELSYSQPDPKNGIEPYLSLKEQAIKAEWFWQNWLNHVASAEGLKQEAVERVNYGERLKAYQCYLKEGSPLSLYSAAVLIQEGLEKNVVDRKPDYNKAFELCVKSALPEAFYSLGWLYHFKKIAYTGPTNTYEEAASWYQRCPHIPESMCNLGNLYRDGYLPGGRSFENYQIAREYYLKSGHPNAMWNLGRLYRDGRLGEKDYEKSAQYFRLAHEHEEHKESLCDLGLLYMKGRVGLIDGKPDYEKAKQLYLRSGRREAYGNLLYLLLELKLDTVEGDINYPLAFEYAFKCGFTNPCERMLDITHVAWDKISDVASRLLGCSSSRDTYGAVITLLEKSLKEPQPSYIKALKAYYLDQDWELAKSSFMVAYAAGNTEADFYYKMATRQLELQRLQQESLAESDEIETAVTSESSEEIIPEKDMDSVEVSRESLIVRPNRYKPEKERMSRAERIKHIQDKINKKLGMMVSQFQVRLDDENAREALRPLSIKFVSEDVQKQFDRVTNTSKLTELLSDIEAKPHGVEGAGKPEVLKGKYKGFKGCISRRLDKENRIVYKVTAAREITVISVDGHYY